MEPEDQNEALHRLRQEIAFLRDRERDLADRNEELMAQKEELTAAIDAFIEKSDALEEAVVKLRQRNNELDQILYRTAHDLRAPLTSIEGLVYLRKFANAEEGELDRDILRKVLQMKDLLKALGTLAHASFDEIAYEQIKLHSIVSLAIGALEYLPNYRHLEFRHNVPDTVLLRTDPFLFGIILQALISNAITFREPGSKGYVAVDCACNDGEMLIHVSDDGEGVQPECSDKIFDMFYRASERSIGPGLGLYVSRQLLSRFGGELTFKCEEGKTMFTIHLPMKEKEP